MKYLSNDDIIFCISFNQQWLKDNRQLEQLEIYQQIKKENKALETELNKRLQK